MRKIFIADAHLRSENDKNYRLLMEFLDGLRGNTDTLYILGDLFEFWIGYREVPFTHYLPILEQLGKLRESGIDIVYFEGNHDFHMGPFFTKTLRATVHGGPATLDIEGKKVFLCHGDEINRLDYGYRLLRLVFHSGLTRALTHIVPPGISSWIAERMGKRSKKSHGTRSTRWNYPAILREFAVERFRSGYDVVISGHFHIPLLESFGEGEGKILLSLGDWLTHFSYGEWEDGKLSLKTYLKP